jgi:hypothetical protein
MMLGCTANDTTHTTHTTQIFDKLCTVFGQDIWDALFLRAVADSRLPRNALRLGLHFIAALVYVDILFTPPVPRVSCHVRMCRACRWSYVARGAWRVSCNQVLAP